MARERPCTPSRGGAREPGQGPGLARRCCSRLYPVTVKGQMNRQPRNSQHLHGFSQGGRTLTPSPLTSKPSKNALFQKHEQLGFHDLHWPSPLRGPHPSEGPKSPPRRFLFLMAKPKNQNGWCTGAAQLRERSLTRGAARSPRRTAAWLEHLPRRNQAAGSLGGRRCGEFSPYLPQPLLSLRQPAGPVQGRPRLAESPSPPLARSRPPLAYPRHPEPPLPEPVMWTRSGRPLLEHDDRSLWERPRGLGSPGSLRRAGGGGSGTSAATCPTGSPGDSAGRLPASAIGSRGGRSGGPGGPGAGAALRRAR